MDQAGIRTLISQVSDDFAWLEGHARQQPEQAARAGELRLAAALVRNLLGPFLEKQAAAPLHVAVVGGAGAGKSTVSNFLCGAQVAESNPQAGFTRHPIAYTSANGQLTWPAHLGFLGPLKRLTRDAPANLDEDIYQVRRVASQEGTSALLEQFVVWDCPDVTTWHAVHYIPRVLEVCGLADIIIYVASDERYNDEVPTQFLKLLLRAEKSVLVCLVKMKEEQAAAFRAHFEKEVLSKLPGRAAAIITIPQLRYDQLANPVQNAAAYRAPLVEKVAALGTPVLAARLRSVQHAMHFLEASQNELLSVARDDLAALDGWRGLVQGGQLEFDDRYRREYLTSARFRRFDEALVKLLDLLELPGLGKIVSTALYVVRTPYRLVKSLFSRAVQRPEAPAFPEKSVLDAAFTGWLDMVRKEATRRAGTHPLWQHVSKGFAAGLADQARQKYEEGVRSFQLSMTDEVERTARSIYEDLERNPVALNTLRGTKFAMEVAAITGSIALGGINVFDLVLVPVAASVTQYLVEALGSQYVENQREQARARQQMLVTQHISGPLAAWLIQWPSTGGSAYERLQLALRRLPPALQQLDAAVQAAVKEAVPVAALPIG